MMNSARNKTPTRLRKSIKDLTSGAKASTSLIGGKDAEQVNDLWVTHVQKHHSKHLVYQGINLNRKLLDMNLEIFSQISTNIPPTKDEGKVQTFQDDKLKIVRRITESIKGFNRQVKENELKKNIEIEIEKEFLTKYLESESENEEESDEDIDVEAGIKGGSSIGGDDY